MTELEDQIERQSSGEVFNLTDEQVDLLLNDEEVPQQAKAASTPRQGAVSPDFSPDDTIIKPPPGFPQLCEINKSMEKLQIQSNTMEEGSFEPLFVLPTQARVISFPALEEGSSGSVKKTFIFFRQRDSTLIHLILGPDTRTRYRIPKKSLQSCTHTNQSEEMNQAHGNSSNAMEAEDFPGQDSLDMRQMAIWLQNIRIV